MRPRFVIVLAAAAVLAAGATLARLPSALGDEPSRRLVFGHDLGGPTAAMLIVLESTAYLVTAVGLWQLRRWARVVAMAYLALVIVSFLFFGVSAGDGRRATAVMLWQLTVVPFATFCFMFLYNGARYFGRDAAPGTPPGLERGDEGASFS